MNGNELLDKMELIDPAYIEAADAQPNARRRVRIKWGALAACICTLEDFAQPIPAPSAPDAVEHAERAVVALIDIDTLKYREETDSRAVRKNVSMPAWLSLMAERAGINCSAVLQEALMHRLHLR